MADLVADNRIAELAVLDQDAIAGILAELRIELKLVARERAEVELRGGFPGAAVGVEDDAALGIERLPVEEPIREIVERFKAQDLGPVG